MPDKYDWDELDNLWFEIEQQQEIDSACNNFPKEKTGKHLQIMKPGCNCAACVSWRKAIKQPEGE